MEKESAGFVINVKKPQRISQPRPKPDNTPSVPPFKEQFKDQASKQLESFLEFNKKLIFPYYEKPQVSIVIVTYTQTALELLCFMSILRWANGFPYEVVISNNGSSEDNKRLLESLTNVNIINHRDNLGFVTGVNYGVEQARGEYVLLLNDDAMVTYNCIQNMAKRLELWEKTKIGVVGAQIRLLDNTIQDAGGILRRNGEAQEKVGVAWMTETCRFSGIKPSRSKRDPCDHTPK